MAPGARQDAPPRQRDPACFHARRRPSGCWPPALTSEKPPSSCSCWALACGRPSSATSQWAAWTLSWLERYQRQGMARLCDEPRSGRPPRNRIWLPPWTAQAGERRTVATTQAMPGWRSATYGTWWRGPGCEPRSLRCLLQSRHQAPSRALSAPVACAHSFLDHPCAGVGLVTKASTSASSAETIS
jgi:hypothetical protein